MPSLVGSQLVHRARGITREIPLDVWNTTYKPQGSRKEIETMCPKNAPKWPKDGKMVNPVVVALRLQQEFLRSLPCAQ